MRTISSTNTRSVRDKKKDIKNFLFTFIHFSFFEKYSDNQRPTRWLEDYIPFLRFYFTYFFILLGAKDMSVLLNKLVEAIRENKFPYLMHCISFYLTKYFTPYLHDSGGFLSEYYLCVMPK